MDAVYIRHLQADRVAGLQPGWTAGRLERWNWTSDDLTQWNGAVQYMPQAARVYRCPQRPGSPRTVAAFTVRNGHGAGVCVAECDATVSNESAARPFPSPAVLSWWSGRRSS